MNSHRLAVTLLSFMLLVCGHVFAAELRVPDSYATIAEALAASQDGDTVRVAAGTYSAATGESFPLRLNKAVALEGDPANKAALVGDKTHTVVSVETGGVTLRGLSITDGNGSEGINGMDGGGVCIFVGPGETRPVTIDNCIIEDCTSPSDETYDGCGGGIYCGGTYCTCFQITISNCVVRGNSVRGCGGGVFCSLLSSVEIGDTRIEENVADDYGGGVFVDVYASLVLTGSSLVANDCPGDPLKPDWGGKGGGLACESYGLFMAADCNFADNEARYFGGGIFTRGGLFQEEAVCGNCAGPPRISNSLIEKNRADVAGGGVYVASSGILSLSGTTLYWNDAGWDGGGLFVAGSATSAGLVECSDGCLLEGNESGRYGGGVYLDQRATGTFESTRFLGDSTLLDGGGLYVGESAAATLNDCLMTYNNTARGHGGGLYLGPQSTADLVHCTVAGNFSPYKRSGLYLDPAASVDIADSILWRNAGGSLEYNGGTVNMTWSLSEDEVPDPNLGLLSGDPGYVGWGGLDTVSVVGSAQRPGIGTPAAPYQDLQVALDGFDLRLAANSPCIGAAGDGGNLGADTGVGGDAGNTTAALHLEGGTYDIRGRNIIFIRDVQGFGMPVIQHAVFGHVEEGFMKDLAITSEEIFGGITTRADVNFVNCTVSDNTSLADGGGIYIADGNCVMSDSLVSGNTCHEGDGGGIYAAVETSLSLMNGTIQSNRSGAWGGGVFLEADTVSLIEDSTVQSNVANRGGGLFVSGALEIGHSVIKGNHADIPMPNVQTQGGGIFVKGCASVILRDSTIAENNATSAGGGLSCHGETQVTDCAVNANTSQNGGGILHSTGTLKCQDCGFSNNKANKANDNGGAVYIGAGLDPNFLECTFSGNVGFRGGVGYCSGSQATFDQCEFKNNTSVKPNGNGGCFHLSGTETKFRNCTFTNSSARNTGGTMYFDGADGSTLEDCTIDGSTAGSWGGALYLAGSAEPNFTGTTIMNASSTYGGGIFVGGTTKPRFIDSRIAQCQATTFGGGFFACDSSQSVFESCEFLENKTTASSADGAGAYFSESAAGTFMGCCFRQNEAKDDGGGVAAADNANVTLGNTLFAANTAGNTGGGAYFTSTSVGTLTNCTMVSNEADGLSGGGIYMDPTSTVAVDSSVVWQNNPDGIRSGVSPTVSYCCVQEAWPGTGNIFSDPLLDPATFGLLDGSPCIDAGNLDRRMNDACLPPGQGTPRNDMGFTGGPDNCRLCR